MITTVTLNPAIDREYFVSQNKPKLHQFIYSKNNVNITPGGKGLISAIDLANMGYDNVQNIGFVGGRQGIFFEKMVQQYNVTTNYIYTNNEIRNNVQIASSDPVTYTYFNDYTFSVESKDEEQLIKRFSRSIADSDFILISGSIPSGVNFNIYEKLIEICNNQKKEVLLQASGEALNLALKQKPKIVVPYFKHSDTILDKKIGEDSDYILSGRRLIEEGAQYVIIPFHCNRLLFTDNKIYILSAKNFCLRSWLGTSDAYNAGFIDYIIRNGFDFLEANRFAGAAALHIAGSKSNFINNRSEIEKKLDEITIKEWRD